MGQLVEEIKLKSSLDFVPGIMDNENVLVSVQGIYLDKPIFGWVIVNTGVPGHFLNPYAFLCQTTEVGNYVLVVDKQFTTFISPSKLSNIPFSFCFPEIII